MLQLTYIPVPLAKCIRRGIGVPDSCWRSRRFLCTSPT